MVLVKYSNVLYLQIFACNAATMQKRDAEQSSVISDANQAIDKLFEDLNKGVQQLAKDGINVSIETLHIITCSYL